jgi:hypothetical protein
MNNSQWNYSIKNELYLLFLNEPGIPQIIQPKCNCKMVSIYIYIQRINTTTIDRNAVIYAHNQFYLAGVYQGERHSGIEQIRRTQ